MRSALRRAALAVLGAAAVFCATGCATMAHGTRQNVIVKSDPPGAQVYVGGKTLGVTPLVADLWRGDRHVVLRFELDGFETQELRLTRDASAMVVADFAVALNPLKMQGMDNADAATYLGSSAAALGIMLGPDLLTGGGYKFPNVVTVTLKRTR